MLIYIDHIYNTPVRMAANSENPQWPFHMKMHYCDINMMTLPENDVELVVFEKQDGDQKDHLNSLNNAVFNTYLAELRNMGVKYVIVDISLKPQTHSSALVYIRQAANTVIVPTKSRVL